MKFPSRAIWLSCLLILLCSACGQKGKLVLPVRPPPVSTPYPTSLPKDDGGETEDTDKANPPVNQQSGDKN